MQLKRVVLPAPFGPITEWMALLPNFDVKALDGDQSTEALGDFPCGEDGVVIVRLFYLAAAAPAGGFAPAGETPPALAPSCSSCRRVASGHKPSGRVSIMKINRAP